MATDPKTLTDAQALTLANTAFDVTVKNTVAKLDNCTFYVYKGDDTFWHADVRWPGGSKDVLLTATGLTLTQISALFSRLWILATGA